MTQIQPVSLAPGLYIVATPLGNVRDITLRALDVLASAEAILCEDTRVSGKLTSRYQIPTRRVAYHEHNAEAMRPKILARLEKGEALALISDAGTPLISDPGMPLVRAAREAGYDVFTVPGASAPIAALSISGMATDRFTFAGFLPTKQGARRRALADLGSQSGTLALFESAKRVGALIDDIEAELGARDICVARELTKKFEELIFGTPETLRAIIAETPPRGELVVLIGAGVKAELGAADVDAMLEDALASMSRRDAVQAVAEMTGLKRKEIYARALSLGAPISGDLTKNNKKEPDDEPVP
jgi:16S rRNA (cytidine1402-2'-O)-methyltransferase